MVFLQEKEGRLGATGKRDASAYEGFHFSQLEAADRRTAGPNWNRFPRGKEVKLSARMELEGCIKT
eukprot:scaffold193973_cov18-Tisochrysis_lutea.AAC.1